MNKENGGRVRARRFLRLKIKTSGVGEYHTDNDKNGDYPPNPFNCSLGLFVK